MGALGGLLSWWDTDKFGMLLAIENKNWLLVKLENKETKEMFWIGNIYGPTIQAHKENFWTSLEDQCEGKKHIPCYIAGDFNVTISADEIIGGSRVRDPFGKRLEDLTSLWGLIDINPKRGKFTWRNKRIGLERIA